MLQVCVNGARPVGGHPRLSASPDAVAREAADAVAHGASSVHVHPKSRSGADSLDGADVARMLAAVRAACPGVPVGITTGAWALPDVDDRLDAVRSWSSLPDVASVNAHEEGADLVAVELLRRGVGVEAGIWHEDGLALWGASASRDRSLRVLVELGDVSDPAEVRARATRLVAGVRALRPDVPVLLHGEERSTWPALVLAAEWGLATRIGLEDCLLLRDGAPAGGNGELVRAARAVMA